MARRAARASRLCEVAYGLAAALVCGHAAIAGAQDAAPPDSSHLDTGAELLVHEDIAEPATAPGLPPLVWTLQSGVDVRLYGQLNYGVLSYDDGRETKTYAPLDNANSTSRIGLLVDYVPNEDWELGGRIELQYAPYSSFQVSVLDRSADFDFDRDNFRWLEVSAEHRRAGTLSVGQGSMATDGITLIDFSDTNVVAYSSVADSAGGQFLRFTDPTLPVADAPRIGQVFQGFDGPRRVRLRYDTPRYRGFGASAAYGRNLLSANSDLRDDDLFDLSMTYGDTLGAFQIGAGVGYFWDRDDREIVSGSASVLHVPTGLNLAVSSAALDTSGRTASYGYVKAGLRRDLFAFGSTALSLDYYGGNDIARADADSTSYAVALTQRVDAANSELWLTYRIYDYDEAGADFEDADALFGGVRFRF